VNEIDRATVLDLLSESSSALEDAVKGVTEERAAGRPPAGGWTIAEITEHVAIAEEQMLFALTQRYREVPDPISEPEREKRILSFMSDRTEKATSPEPSRPTGRFGSLVAALGHFRRCRARTVEYIEQTPDDLRRRTVKHPLAGVISAYEYSLILASHPSRHAAQVRELRAAMGF
jgi:DinB superfamily